MTKPQVIIVDENDHIIGHKPRHARTYSDFYRVTGLWITNSKNQILLAQRKLTKSHDPGKWGPAVSGTVDEGETYEQNVYKEAEEEVGLTGVAFKLGPKRLIDTGEHRFFTQWYTLTLDRPLNEFKIQEAEVEQLKWIDRDELHLDLKQHPERYIREAESVYGAFLS